MAANGLAKLIEECGELIQVAGKLLAYWDIELHPDGSKQRRRLEEEMADVYAALVFVSSAMQLDGRFIMNRKDEKLNRFLSWHSDPTNNTNQVPLPTRGVETAEQEP